MNLSRSASSRAGRASDCLGIGAGDANNEQSAPLAAAEGTAWRWMAASLLWLALVGAGTVWLLDYSNKVGVAGRAPATIPGVSLVRAGGLKPTLVMFAHPQCPCSRASVVQLDRLMARSGQAFNAQVFFLLPAGMNESWSKGSLWRQAAGIPGVRVAVDREGREAALFGAATSGHCVLYDKEGNLLFQGGLTPARGHEGDSVGADAVLQLLKQRGAEVAVAPVFGCGLCEEGGAQ
jgi:hypothetical protein